MRHPVRTYLLFVPSFSAGVLLVFGALVWSSCSGSVPAADAAAQGRGGRAGRGGDASAVPVSTAHAVQKAVPLEVPSVGTAEPLSTVEVRSQVTGQLLTVEFAEGADVQQGQLLFTIDSRPFEVALRQAEAARDKDAAQAANAEAIRSRNESLLKNRLISQADYDTSAATVAALKATLAADAATVESAKLNLQYTKILAPVSGRTGALLVNQGSLVRTADTTPLVIIKQLAPIRVAFAVPAKFLGQIREGQARRPLVVTAKASDEGQATSGSVSFIDNTADPASGTIRLKGTFPNTDHRIWPGDLLQVSLQLAVDPHAIVVPTTAVQNGQQGQFVYVVNADKTVALRPVDVARTAGDDAVIASGVQIGDEVVTDGQLRLQPGVRISVKSPGATRGGR
jgi:multidrug efflux system membrane fusion protein